MAYLFNLLYSSALVVFSPWLVWKACTTGKYRRGLWCKFWGLVPRRESDRPCVWFHGVSVGEVHLLRQVISAFRKRHPDYDIAVSTTTDTGRAEAQKSFPDLVVFYWPFDFSWAVKCALRRLRPELVVLAESEIWPNFLRLAKKASVNVAIINGRMSPRSARRLRHFSFLARPTFRSVNLWCMQNAEYAEAVQQLVETPQGNLQSTICVTGNVKYDGVQSNRHNASTNALRQLLAVQPADLVLVAGSTQAPEEETILTIYERLRADFPPLRLIIVPRQRERFDEVARLLRSAKTEFVRRSELTQPLTNRNAVVLVDTIGELGAVWGLADIAYVGGSLGGKRGGQNMIEPAAYGAAVLFGPHTWNFKETVARLLERDGALQVYDAAKLEYRIRQLLAEGDFRREMGDRARQFVQSQIGATDATVKMLGKLLTKQRRKRAAA